MKRVTFIANAEMVKKAKIKAVINDTDLSHYIIGLIEKDLAKDEKERETDAECR